MLAIVTYLYVRGESVSRDVSIVEREALKELSSKVVPVKVDLKGEPPKGYRILEGNIIVKPQKVIVMGRKEDLNKISEVLTQALDVRKFTHTQVTYLPLLPLENVINISSRMVEVEIPIVVVK